MTTNKFCGLCVRCDGVLEAYRDDSDGSLMLDCKTCAVGVGYALNHWSIRLARIGYRLQRATDTAIQHMQMHDHASWHLEGRPLGRLEEVSCWWSGFKVGWIEASNDGNPWFKRATSTSGLADA